MGLACGQHFYVSLSCGPELLLIHSTAEETFSEADGGNSNNRWWF